MKTYKRLGITWSVKDAHRRPATRLVPHLTEVVRAGNRTKLIKAAPTRMVGRRDGDKVRVSHTIVAAGPWRERLFFGEPVGVTANDKMIDEGYRPIERLVTCGDLITFLRDHFGAATKVEKFWEWQIANDKRFYDKYQEEVFGL